MNRKLIYIGSNLSKKDNYKNSISILSDKFLNDGCEIYVYSNVKNKFFRLLEMCIQVIFKARRVDYLLIDTFSTSNFYYAVIVSQLARIFKLKYILILRGGNLPVRLEKSKILSQLIFKNSYKNIAPSKYLEEAFNKRGYDTELIPNTFNLSNYNFKKREKLAPKLFYVRAFAKIYNPTMAIHVLCKVQKKYPGASLCMVGPDRDGCLSEVKDLVKELNLESSVEFTGVLSKEDWHKKSETFDIFINTTNFDNTPVSAMEIMALGLPIVSTNVGGLPYLHSDGKDALLVAKNDACAMAEKIIFLIENPKMAVELAQNARTKVEAFDWKIVKQKWYKILN